MTFKSNGKKRAPKKLLSAFMCLIIAIVFFALLYLHGFKIGNLVFGFIFLYLSTAFFRTSKAAKRSLLPICFLMVLPESSRVG